MLSPATPPFKASAAEAGLQRLAGYSLLCASGPDAAAFLHAQLMNDVLALAPGQWQWNGWLTAKGRVIGLFALWRRGEQDFVLLLPDFPASELQPLLQRFVFRSKLQLQVLDGFEVAGSQAGVRDKAPGARDFAESDAGGWRFDFGGDVSTRWLLLRPLGEVVQTHADPAFDAAWRSFDLAHGLPRLDASQREAWTPHMLSLQRLRAFSLGKGCYPGQEIVARTHYLGQAKRELVRVRFVDPSARAPEPGASVDSVEGVALGTLACVDREDALAVLQAGRQSGPWRVAGWEVEEAPLLEGLQRPV